MKMAGITTHVLDLTFGTPARGVGVKLELHSMDRGWVTLADRVTDDDGRVKDLLAAGAKLDAGRYRLTFATGPYFASRGQDCFHPEAAITFDVRDGAHHHHVPLLLSPFGYSTYRGS
jgi:5-hydroxyisourate hydrolase